MSAPTNIVHTTGGPVRGATVDGVTAYLGIPYGLMTRRFRRAEPATRRLDVHDGSQPGRPCIQNNPDYPAWLDPTPETEHCLVLNVWTPTNNPAAGLPVMVWIHGGAFSYGSAGIPIYNGANLARDANVVVVSINRRLNAFGYLWIGDIFPELGTHGNLGQQDLVLALRWVQSNMTGFGGALSNVTAFGESGGGAKIGTLLATDAASGLFHKAIIQSGSQTRVHSAEQATVIANASLAKLGAAGTSLQGLEAIGAGEISAAAAEIEGAFGLLAFQPVLDGDHLTHHPWEEGVPPAARGMPLIIGTTRDETVTFLPDLLPDAVTDDIEATTVVHTFLGTPPMPWRDCRVLVARYRQSLPEITSTELALMVTRDLWMWRGALEQVRLRLQSKDPSPTFLFEFDWRTPCFRAQWATHAGELPFVFGNLTYPAAWDGNDDDQLRAIDDKHGHRFRLSREMISSWSSFAHTGTPSTGEIPWAPITALDGETMVFSRETSRTVKDRDRLRRERILTIPAGW